MIEGDVRVEDHHEMLDRGRGEDMRKVVAIAIVCDRARGSEREGRREATRNDDVTFHGWFPLLQSRGVGRNDARNSAATAWCLHRRKLRPAQEPQPVLASGRQ